MVRRIYAEKRPGLNPEAGGLLTDLRDFLGIQGLRSEEHTSELQSQR